MTPEERQEMERSIEQSRKAATAAGKTLEMPNDVFTVIRADGHRYMVMDLNGYGWGWCVAVVPAADWDFETDPLNNYVTKKHCHCEAEAVALARKWNGLAPESTDPIHVLKSI